MDYYMADTPGRLRIESPALKGDPSKAKQFRDLVMALPGVQSIDLRPEIGSATIHYDPHAIDHKALIGEARQERLLRPHEGENARSMPG